MIIITVVAIVDDDTYCRVYMSSDHTFQVYYKVRQLILLQSATAFLLQSSTSVITKCDNFITKCDRTDGPLALWARFLLSNLPLARPSTV